VPYFRNLKIEFLKILFDVVDVTKKNQSFFSASFYACS
jgi:hypothetical protein